MSQHSQSESELKGVASVRLGRTDRVAHGLIHQAARHAPVELSERLEEEWLADLETRASAFSRLRFAIGCCWATRVIAHEHQPVMVAVSTSAVAPKLLMAQTPFNFGRFSSRSSTFFLVMAFHVGVFYLVFTTIAQIHTKTKPTEMQNVSISRPRPADPLPTVPQPNTQLTDVVLDVLKPVVDIPPDLPSTETDLTTKLDDGLGPRRSLPVIVDLPPRAAKQVMGGTGTGFPNPDDYYPSTARYLGEQGVATAQVCVNAKGRLTTDPTVLSSTGSPRLDDAVIRLAKAGSGHYRPSTEDGRALDSCFGVRIRFQLK
jgi:TonB family protein